MESKYQSDKLDFQIANSWDRYVKIYLISVIKYICQRLHVWIM